MHFAIGKMERNPQFFMTGVEKIANNRWHGSCPSLPLEDGAGAELGTSRLFLFHLQQMVWRGAPLHSAVPRLTGCTGVVLSVKEICSTFLLQDFNVLLHIKRIQMTRMNGSSQPHGLIF